MNRAKQIFIAITVLLGLIALTAVAGLSWQSVRLSEQAASGALSISSSQDIAKLPPITPDPLRKLISRASNEAGTNNVLMVELAEMYQQRRPLDPRGWLWGSQFQQRSGDLEGAKADLAVAQQLAIRNTPVLTEVFNRYLEMGLVRESIPVARNLVKAYPASFRRIFYLLTRLDSDYKNTVETMIAGLVPQNNRFPHHFYYRNALLDAVRADNQELAGVVWNSMPGEYKRNTQYGLRYLNYLVGAQQYQPVADVWSEFTGGELEISKVFTPKFNVELPEFSPCWRRVPTDAASWSLDSITNPDDTALLIEFSGKENTNYSHIRCVVAVEPYKSYKLSGKWKGQGITTLSGPFVDVHAPGNSGFSERSESLLGSWPWIEFEFEFSVPSGVNLIEIRLRRSKTDYLDSKISGKVWFNDFRLSQLPGDDLQLLQNESNLDE